ncbi:PhzF family phenazine biosynthesis protein [Spirosoma validum]|uniref:PhzF family phenazine biosynthesis protein n=1 Tax=Spirosoma validum TaxID=2771355 RepID=A0A927GEL0_9BACT|nr:PhzF family phenazine biosynthesis protein [Spirosoma validum]MBD2754942.1 PhzF family phenazine biosynthesis protein [Spirosoma validum]
MNVRVKIINAFSIDNAGGNPAGVVLNADALTSAEKQQIAAKVGVPETAFVSRSQTAAIKLDFFTPAKQIPHCGHATIAVFSYLRQQGLLSGDVSSKETIDGNRTIFFESGKAFMEQKAPTYSKPERDYPVIYQSIGITEEDLVPGLSPMIVNTGNSFLVIPLNDERILTNLNPNFEQIQAISGRYGLIGYYAYTQPENDTFLQATTRMFAPLYGIDEESATGMAAGPLACFLYDNNLVDTNLIRIEQGKFMSHPSRSLLEVRLETESRTIKKLFAGGNAYVSGERVI